MNNLRILHYIFLSLFVSFFFASCKTQKTVTADKRSSQDTLGYQESRQAENLFLSGMKYYILEDYDKAMEYFQKSHVVYPNSAGTNFQIAQMYIGSGYPEQALAFAEKSLALNDSNIYYYQLLANCYSALAENAKDEKTRKNYLKKSAQTYEALVTKYPSEDDVYFELANLYLQMGDVEKGLSSIDKIEEKYGVTEEISMQKQQIYLHINQFDKAVSESEKLISAFPNESKHKVNLAKLYFTNDMPDKAKQTLQKMGDESDLDGESKVMLSDIYWSLDEKEKSNQLLLEAFKDLEYPENQKINIIVGFINTTNNRMSDEMLDEACKTIIELHPENPKSYIVYGDFLLKKEKKEEGRNQYLKALKMDDSFFQVWQNVIIIDSELGEQDSIIKHTDKALEIFPNQGIFWYYNGAAYLTKKEYEKSTYAFEKTQKLINKNNTLYIIATAQLGDAYHGMKDYVKSDEAFEEVLSIDPNNVHVLNNYSYFLSLRKEKLDMAKQMCDRLLSLEPDVSTYLDTYAWVLYQLGEYQEALDLLQRALQSSNDGTIIEHYGDVLYKLGKKSEAVKQWKLAKETGDYSEFLEKKIADEKLYE